MKPSAKRAPLALSILFGLGCLGLLAWLWPTAAPVKVQSAKTQLVGQDFASARPAVPPPPLAGRGELDLVLTVDGKAANTVRVSLR